MIHCYKLCGYNIVIDIASGSIHSVDDLAYDVICSIKQGGRHPAFYRDDLIKHIITKHSGVPESDIQEIIDDIEMLQKRGKLFSADIFADIAMDKHDTQLSALCLNVSHKCNMSCAYCFADYRKQGDGSSASYLMSLETGKKAIDFLVSQSGDRINLDVDFFGGEPLLNWDVVKDIVRYAREIERKSRKKFRFTLTTNGLLIDDDVINFTNNHMKNVVLSLDGRPEIHDAMRKLPSGDGSYSAVIGNIKRLVDARRGKGYYIRGTFTAKNKDFVNDILHIADLGYKEISMEPVVPSRQGFAEAQEPSLCFQKPSLCLRELFEQYETLAIEMLRREKLGMGFNFYHFNLDLTGGPCVHKRIAGCGVGTEYMAVTPSGDLYPCHQFIGDPKFLLGDIWRGAVNDGLREEFSKCSIYSRKECRECWVRFYCSGGCAANAYHDSGSINTVYDIGCELFKKRIECAIMMQVAQNK